MIEVPKRISLIEQVADVLRRNLSSREWRNGLPPERTLSDHFHISRPTLNAALRLLQRQGLVRVPQQVSLVSCDDGWFMRFVTPTVARYDFNSKAYARRLSRMVVQLAATGALPQRHVRAIGAFQEGQTLAAAPTPTD